ncbi:MAG: Crp/Fnr family transcriptional regulator [Bradyrhizobiaceae bacterium]|nr:MAG: Crp/Fnr family transcriptional regulator [Bradyrhizobiaceae bacterium]
MMHLGGNGSQLSAALAAGSDNVVPLKALNDRPFNKFLSPLNDLETRLVTSLGRQDTFKKGELVFRQGMLHSGLHIIKKGGVRTFFVSPGGREITLAYWVSGDFVGTPEVFGRGKHLWSGMATDNTEAYYLTGEQLQELAVQMPKFALVLIDVLVAKGKCFSRLIHTLGTKNACARLAHTLLLMCSPDDKPDSSGMRSSSLTHDQLASTIGVSRQWVSASLREFESEGLLKLEKKKITIVDYEGLKQRSF